MKVSPEGKPSWHHGAQSAAGSRGVRQLLLQFGSGTQGPKFSLVCLQCKSSRLNLREPFGLGLGQTSHKLKGVPSVFPHKTLKITALCAVWYPGLDLGGEKTHLWKKLMKSK